MSLDSIREQETITKIALVFMVLFVSIAFFMGKRWAAGGSIFGSTLAILNNHAVALIFRKAFRNKVQVSEIILFLGYHLRFAILVLALYLVIPKTNVEFGFGTFLGFFTAKIGMGVAVFQEEKEDNVKKL